MEEENHRVTSPWNDTSEEEKEHSSYKNSGILYTVY